jgi:hypothetical protein
LILLWALQDSEHYKTRIWDFQQLEVFRENRPTIEEIARRKYLSRRVEPDGTMLIHTADIPH